MKVTFTDFYGQYVSIHNETSSGNVRLKVSSTSDLNLVHTTKEEDCDIETDISLDESRLRILIGALQAMEQAL